MQIYELLKKDHDVVQDLMDRLLALSDEDESHFELVEQIRDELIPHSRAEEAVFYNAIRALDADSGQIMHSYKEHMEAETLLRSLQVKEKVNLDWKKTAVKLKEALDHHIQEEETKVFALGRKMLTDEDAEKIGAAFERLKPEVREEGFVKTSLEMVKNLMPAKLSKIVELTDVKQRRH